MAGTAALKEARQLRDKLEEEAKAQVRRAAARTAGAKRARGPAQQVLP